MLDQPLLVVNKLLPLVQVVVVAVVLMLYHLQHQQQPDQIQIIIKVLLVMVVIPQHPQAAHPIVHQCKQKFVCVLKNKYKINAISPIIFSSSNFKRQNTIDSASIKENAARLAQNPRPASAQPKAVSSTDSMYLYTAKRIL